VQNDEFVTDLTGAVTAIQVASASAVKSYVDAKASDGGAKTVIENAVVAGSSITLANAPKDGLASVLNFGTVRYNDGVQSFDAPLMSTADPKVFTVGTDAAGDWDTFTVQVQYQFTSVA